MAKHSIIVALGSDEASNAEQYGYYAPTALTYSFDTEAELTAFIKGLNTMNGNNGVSYMDASALPDHEIVLLSSANCLLSIPTASTIQFDEYGNPDYGEPIELDDIQEGDWFRSLSDEDIDQIKRALPNLKNYTKDQIADAARHSEHLSELPDEYDLQMPDYDAFLDNYKPEYNALEREKLGEPTEEQLENMTSYNGRMYETYGQELAYVMAQPAVKIWTLIEAEGKQYISPGFHIVNRLGYFITEVSWVVGNEDHYAG